MMQRIRNLYVLLQLNGSAEALSQAKRDIPPILAPYNAEAVQTVRIFKNGLAWAGKSTRNRACIQLLPIQMTREVSIKKQLAAAICQKEK